MASHLGHELFGGQRSTIQQRRLVAYDRQQVVVALIHDLAGNVLLEPHVALVSYGAGQFNVLEHELCWVFNPSG
jgi:hypothetical protein